MDQVKPPHPWVTPGITLPKLTLPENPLTFKELVLEQLCIRYNVTVQELRGRWRPRRLSYVRQLFCYLMKQCYGKKAALNWIANILDIDHTSVITAIKVYKDQIAINGIMDERIPVQGERFDTVTEDYNHFKLILYKCLQPDTVLSVYQAALAQEKTP